MGIEGNPKYLISLSIRSPMTSSAKPNENLGIIQEINENKEPGESMKIVRQ
jgi:hypothetical protein